MTSVGYFACRKVVVQGGVLAQNVYVGTMQNPQTVNIALYIRLLYINYMKNE